MSETTIQQTVAEAFAVDPVLCIACDACCQDFPEIFFMGKDEKAHAEPIEKLTRWCLRAMTVPEGKAAVRGWVSFRLPEGIDHQKLVPIVPLNDQVGRVAGPPAARTTPRAPISSCGTTKGRTC